MTRLTDSHILKSNQRNDLFLHRTGAWFDGTTPTIETNEKFVPDFAPRYVMEHRERYRKLLVPPDSLKLPRNWQDGR